MENASKALIIAASILVAIMLVAMGVTILNKAQSSADTTSLDTTEITMFNQKFERYSDDQLGSQVKSLISFCISNASTNKDDPSCLPTVALTDGTTASGGSSASDNNATYISNLGKIRKEVVSTSTYSVECGYAGTGLINSITITKK